MDNAWIIAFYKETDPVKRLELLKANTGDGESEKDKYRKQLWIARYGKRTPVKDEFMRCLMEMKYLAEGTTVDLGGKRRKQGAKIAATLGLSESLLQEKIYKEIREMNSRYSKDQIPTIFFNSHDMESIYVTCIWNGTDVRRRGDKKDCAAD